jgi:FAD/FMN-containing dehydrogenase
MNPYPMLARTNSKEHDELDKLKNWWNEFNTELVRMGCVQYLMGDVLPEENYVVLGPLYEFIRRLKKFMDPNNIMNPSRVFGGL